MPSAISTAYSSLPFALSLALHIIVGSAGVYLYWRTILLKKGSAMHRTFGKRYFVVMCLVAFSVGPLIFTRPGEFDPAYAVQFIYLVVCLTGIVIIGWTSIRWKNDLARFRGWHFRGYGFAMSLLGVIVLGAGVATGSFLTASFSLIGLIYGPVILRFAFMKNEPQDRWHVSWHVNAISGLFNAVHANILAVAYERMFDPGVGDAAIIVTFYATGVVAIGIRIWAARYHNAPLRFTNRAADAVPA